MKYQPAFRPTWQGFLATTKDAMTVVEAALQGRLNHINRRPHDKERAEMLSSGNVFVYEENASGINNWTDAVHWSPSRATNHWRTYRQSVLALKSGENGIALSPSCSRKRKHKESLRLSVPKINDHVNRSDDEDENPSVDGLRLDEADPRGKVYTDLTKSIFPDRQRGLCGSLIDSYEVEGEGLMKKTICVRYQGIHHHVISYYSLEDVVSGKLKRPIQDPMLQDVRPRPGLLTGLESDLGNERSSDMPPIAYYPQST